MQLHPDVVYNCLLTEENPSHTLRRLIMLEKNASEHDAKGILYFCSLGETIF